jgi:hypothetical protein
MTAKERKYGKNDLDHLVLCPRCVDAVPVRIEDGKMYCRKCETLQHVDGALIAEISRERS